MALFAAFMACASRSAERLLWGAMLCSLGLGFAVQVSGGSYYGLLMLAAFLVTDFVVYLYFRTQNIAPSLSPKNIRLDRMARVFFFWIAACAVVGGGIFLFQAEPSLPMRSENGHSLELLHTRIWAADWLLVFIPVLTLVGMVIGGFFLVRKER